MDNGIVSSFDSLFREFIDGEGHTAIHFAASRNAIDTVKWILEKDPGCVCSFYSFNVFYHYRLTFWITMATLL